jgi:hypothetical protein
MSSRLESLPNEFLQDIFYTIEASETAACRYPSRTCVSLSLTSKRCRSLVTRYVFYQLVFSTIGFEELEEELADCRRTLSRLGCIHDAQYFHITVRGSRGYRVKPAYYGAQEGEKVAEIHEEFPNMRGVFVCLDGSTAVPNDFFDGMKRVLGENITGWVTSAGHFCCWRFQKA